MQTGINIGTHISKESLEPLTDAIIKIMGMSGDQETIRHALDTLSRVAKVENITFKDMTMTGDRVINIDPAGEVTSKYADGNSS